MISLSNNLWFFGLDNAPPPTFTLGNIMATATLAGVTATAFTWTVTQGSSKVSFALDTPQPTVSTSEGTVQLYSISYITSVKDVTITAAWTDPTNGPSSQTLCLTVDSPYLLGVINVSGPYAVGDCTVFAAGNVGWHTKYTWDMISKFGVEMYGQSLNENFEAPQDAQPNNWTFTPNGATGVSMQSTFIDTYCFANQAAARPPTMVPQNPLGNDLVDYVTQFYNVGSVQVGSGVTVQTQTLSRYTDHPTVTNIVSPVRNQ